jgi:hypothetical protein
MSAGDLVTFMMFMMHFGASAGVFADYAFVRIREARAATTRLFAIIDRPSHQLGFAALGGVPPVCAAPPRDEDVLGGLQFENVNFCYHTRISVPILIDFNVTISAGATVAFVGPSGTLHSPLYSYCTHRCTHTARILHAYCTHTALTLHSPLVLQAQVSRRCSTYCSVSTSLPGGGYYLTGGTLRA